MADVVVKSAELFSVNLPKASQHNFILTEEGFDLSRPCDQILKFASAGPHPCAEQKLSRFPTHFTFYLVTAFDGVPTATSLALGEISGSDDCPGLNGSERWSLETVLIHKTPAGLSPRFNSWLPAVVELLSNSMRGLFLPVRL